MQRIRLLDKQDKKNKQCSLLATSGCNNKLRVLLMQVMSYMILSYKQPPCLSSSSEDTLVVYHLQ